MFDLTRPEGTPCPTDSQIRPGTQPEVSQDGGADVRGRRPYGPVGGTPLPVDPCVDGPPAAGCGGLTAMNRSATRANTPGTALT